jgi:chemotaxis protein methyltransferase CheR
MAMPLTDLAAAAEAAAPPGVRPITAHELGLFKDLVYRETGIFLGPHKKHLVMSRLAGRMRQLGVTRFGDYFTQAAGDADERRRMIESLCTHETSFFREIRQFELLESRILPEWKAAADAGRRTRRVRLWSAGCATGEEPFSFAMLLALHLPAAAGWDCGVLATDLSTRALAGAESATWPMRRAAEIRPLLLQRFMLKGVRSREGSFQASAELRAMVRCQQLNLNDASYPIAEALDLIACRNVLIYFDATARERVVDRLLHHLAPGGYLFLGHAESLLGKTERLRPVIPSVYVRDGALPGR